MTLLHSHCTTNSNFVASSNLVLDTAPAGIFASFDPNGMVSPSTGAKESRDSDEFAPTTTALNLSHILNVIQKIFQLVS